jgi:ceramide glucosyltransferase
VFPTPALLLFYFFAAISIWLGLVSLRGGVRFARYLKAELASSYAGFTPFVTVCVPCRGVDDGLKENVLAILTQAYPAFEIIFVSDDAGDPALAIVNEACATFETGPRIQIVISGSATDSGQKVHNLRAAVAAADPQSMVFAFVDTDARASKTWLRDLVAPLGNSELGATTGYRWFVARGGFAAHLRSVWNAAIASALGAQTDKNFCWGGSTAIRRDTFERLGIAERWRGTVSDDFTLTNILREGRLPIKFVPQCLTPAFDDCAVGELIEFTTRQLKITRAYAPHLWKAVLTGSALFTLVFFGGIILVIARVAMGLSFATLLVLLLIIFGLGATKSWLRLRAVRGVIPDNRVGSFAITVAHITLWPLASLLFLYNALAAAASRRIKWRGITYELKSPTETVIIRRDD